MTQYLLSMYQPDGVTPPAAALTKVMQDPTLIEDAKSAGVGVQRRPPRQLRHRRPVQHGDALITDGPVEEGGHRRIP